MTNLNPSWLNAITHIAWDLDGTFYPPNKALSKFIHQQVINQVATIQNCTTAEAEQRYQAKYQQLHSNTKTLESFGIKGQQFFVSLWREQDLSPYIKPNPSLVAAFKQVQKNQPYHHAILTNSNTIDTVKKKLELIGLSIDDFEPIVTSVNVGFNKPDQRIFKTLIDLCQTEPDKIIYVGDREHTDIIPAQKAGLRTVLVSAKKPSSQADLVVATAKEMLEILAKK